MKYPRFLILLLALLPLSLTAVNTKDSLRISSTVNSPTIPIGGPMILTWSIAQDGTPLSTYAYTGTGDPVSNLIARFDEIYAVAPADRTADLTNRPWFAVFQEVFFNYSRKSGITYIYEPNDDGASLGNSATGIAGVRGDIRIAGTAISLFGYNNYPALGSDMVLNTVDSRFSNLGTLKFIVTHEHAHGLGFYHALVNNSGNASVVSPSGGNSNGPQFCDLLQIHRKYGDKFEKGNGNDSLETAVFLGTLDTKTDLIEIGTDAAENGISAAQEDFVSIDDETDQDFFTITKSVTAPLWVQVLPVGPTYTYVNEGSSQTLTFVTAEQSDLTLALYDSAGQQIATADAAGLGGGEAINNQVLPAGDYTIRVGGKTNAAQMYRLSVFAGQKVVNTSEAAGEASFDFGPATIQAFLGAAATTPNARISSGDLSFLGVDSSTLAADNNTNAINDSDGVWGGADQERLRIEIDPQNGLSELVWLWSLAAGSLASDGVSINGFKEDPGAVFSGGIGSVSAVSYVGGDGETYGTLRFQISELSGTERTITFTNPEASKGATLEITVAGSSTPNPQFAIQSLSFKELSSGTGQGPAIGNAGFEVNSFNSGVGYISLNTVITGWTASRDSGAGLNPAGSSPFANNGAIPEGANVAFIQGTSTLTSLFGMTGLETGKIYNLTYRANARSQSGNPTPKMGLILGGNEVLSNGVTPVGGSAPYKYVSHNFTATAPTMSLAIDNSYNGDSSLLLDAFTINEVTPKITVSAWDGDPSSGIDNSLTYTHAYNLGSASNATVNGVPFSGVSGGNPAVANRFTYNMPSQTSDANDITTGGSALLANGFVYNNGNASLSLEGLTAGQSYRTTIFTVGFDSIGTGRHSTIAVGEQRLSVNVNTFGNNKGTRVEIEFTATATSQEITLQALDAGTFHTYAFANAEIIEPESYSGWTTGYPALDLSDPEEDLDLDGLANMVEAWLGTHPGQSNAVFTNLIKGGTTTTFTHPQSANPPSDLSARYQWSPDLINWYDGDGVDGPVAGARLTIVPTTAGSTTTVTATSSEAMPQLFLRVQVTQN